ncbi:MAG: transposase [Planctomycetes bacterium]|nr:transposase [Planctomycetota bacterium]
MLLGRKFAQFVEESPISVMMRGVVEYAFDGDRLNAIFENTAEVQYTRELQFATVADLMAEVVFDISPSIGAAYQANIDQMTVSRKSVYNKLNRIEPGISAALVADSVTQFAPVIQQLRATLPPLLKGYRTKILDGNHFSATEHRIKELRTVGDAPLPGKALVVLDPLLKLATHVFPCEDGHAQERSLLGQVLPCVEKDDLWIEDRNFCTLGFLFGVRSRGGRFLVREHANLPGTLRGRLKYRGRIQTGRVYEQAMEITDPSTGDTITIRRITVKLNKPTRDGDTELHVLTDLPARDADARKVANLYRTRWSIETMFQELTETLTCEIKTLGYPKAAIFAFCLALVAYNGISVIKAALRSVHGTDTVEEQVSGFYLSLEISQTYTGMMIAIPAKHWTVFRDMTVAQLAKVLKDLARRVDLSKYQKHPRGPKLPRPERVRTGRSNHVSTARIIATRKAGN